MSSNESTNCGWLEAIVFIVCRKFYVPFRPIERVGVVVVSLPPRHHKIQTMLIITRFSVAL